MRVIRPVMLKIGIIGCGNIGSQLAKAVVKDFKSKAILVAISDKDLKNAARLSKIIRPKPKIFSIPQLIKKSDLVIEAASAGISANILKQCVKNKKDILIMSIGGLLARPKLLFAAAKKNVCVYLPSGAISGIDGIKAASIGKIKKVTLTTTKPPQGLKGAPYIIKNKIDLDRIKRKTVIFSGPASEAVTAFPANINVSAVLSLAGIGPKKTIVKIVADPASKRNIHSIEAQGDFGKISTITENVPSVANPKTSQLAVFSAIAMIRQILNSVKIGT